MPHPFNRPEACFDQTRLIFSPNLPLPPPFKLFPKDPIEGANPARPAQRRLGGPVHVPAARRGAQGRSVGVGREAGRSRSGARQSAGTQRSTPQHISRCFPAKTWNRIERCRRPRPLSVFRVSSETTNRLRLCLVLVHTAGRKRTNSIRKRKHIMQINRDNACRS